MVLVHPSELGYIKIPVPQASTPAGIPHEIGMIPELFRDQLAQFEQMRAELSPGALLISNLDALSIVPRLVDQAVLTPTLVGIGFDDTPHRLSTSVIQAGHKAFIYLTRVDGSHDQGHFITTVSRYPTDTPEGRASTKEATELGQLSDSFAEHVRPSQRDQFRVVRPLASGNISILGKRLPMHTTPFIPKGEMRIGGLRIDSANMIPYVRYGVPYNDRMEDANDRAHRAATDVRNNLFAQGSISGSIFNPRNLAQLRCFEHHTLRQLDDIVTGQLLTYLLSSGRFPKEHMIDAGDWMVEKREDDGLDLELITLRGGLEHVTLEQMHDFITNQTGIWDGLGSAPFKLYADPRQWNRIVQKTMAAIDHDSPKRGAFGSLLGIATDKS